MAEHGVLTTVRPSLLDVLVLPVALATLIASSLMLFGLDSRDGPISVALVECPAIAALIALKSRYSREEVRSAGQEAIALMVIPAVRSSYTRLALTLLYGVTGFKAEKVEPGPLDQSPGRE